MNWTWRQHHVRHLTLVGKTSSIGFSEFWYWHGREISVSNLDAVTSSLPLLGSTDAKAQSARNSVTKGTSAYVIGTLPIWSLGYTSWTLCKYPSFQVEIGKKPITSHFHDYRGLGSGVLLEAYKPITSCKQLRQRDFPCCTDFHKNMRTFYGHFFYITTKIWKTAHYSSVTWFTFFNCKYYSMHT